MNYYIKTMILGFFVLTLALGFTSCGDKEDDPKPSDSNIVTLDQLVGTFKTTSVLYNNITFTDVCDPNWGTTVNGMRKIDLIFKGGTNNFTDLINYRCVSNVPTTNTINDNIASISNNVLDLEGAYKFKILSYSNNILKLELLSTSSIKTPIGAVYTMSKQ